MRVIVVEPGPNFSVQDVCNGWVEGFEALGHDVKRYPFGDVMTLVHAALTATDTPDPDHGAAMIAGRDLRGCCFDFLPDLVVIVSGFFVPPECYEILRSRGIKVAVLLTESPYEDDSQILIAQAADLAAVNDPTNLDRYPDGTLYLPHAYRPMHLQGTAREDLTCDVAFVGTGYPSRIEFLEAVDWTGLDVALAGNWQALDDDSSLCKFVAHDREVCFENSDTVDLYASCQVSVNLYRTEAARPELSQGWAMGPREVELAASGTFFLTQARGENRDVLPMVPTFDGPSDLGDSLRDWLARPEERFERASAAADAVRDRTFTKNARELLAAL